MKINLVPFFLFLFATSNAKAQLFISPSSNLYLSGNAQLTLDNIYFVNNGTFTPGNSTVTFKGNTSAVIMGTTPPTTFYNINLALGTNTLFQYQSISVTNELSFTSGYFDLQGYDIDLGATGSVTGESETAGVITSITGNVIATATLNAPAGANPGNLGAEISSLQNLGNVTITRRHNSMSVTGIGKSVKRSYLITPSINTGLNATLTLNYFDRELNTLIEPDLSIWNTNDNVTWLNRGRSSFSTVSNFVTKTAINSFGTETLSSLSSPLPVHFIAFNQTCNNGQALLSWKTAQEQNSLRFSVEKSDDGINWNTIGSLPAAGISSDVRSYTYQDINSSDHSFYRIVEYDINGRSTISTILRSSCSVAARFQVWPNPFRDKLNIQIRSTVSGPATFKLYNSAGVLVQVMNVQLVNGNNSVSLPATNLAAGIYQLDAGEGRIIKLLKTN